MKAMQLLLISTLIVCAGACSRKSEPEETASTAAEPLAAAPEPVTPTATCQPTRNSRITAAVAAVPASVPSATRLRRMSRMSVS